MMGVDANFTPLVTMKGVVAVIGEQNRILM
jgi:hypothetical protein